MATPAPALEVVSSRPVLRTQRSGLIGYFILGLTIGAPAVLWPAWKLHLQPPFLGIAFHYLALGLGLAFGFRLPGWMSRWEGISWMRTSCLALSAVFLSLAWVSGTTPQSIRHPLFWLLGLALGALLESCADRAEPLYEQNQAATVNLSGGLFGLGILVSALGAALFNALDALRFFPMLIGLALLAFVAQQTRTTPARSSRPRPRSRWNRFLQEIQSPVHVLFAAILLFETASEFSVLQWSTLHLILRCGISPASALLFLAFYAFCLLAGRYLAQAALRQYSGRLLLLVSALTAWTGLFIFETVNNTVGATVGLGFSAIGFSFVYPLLIEKIGNRFEEYRFGEFHGIFGWALLGGFLAPAIIGFWAAFDQESVAMSLPFWSSLMVFLLLVFVWIESKINALQAPRQ